MASVLTNDVLKGDATHRYDVARHQELTALGVLRAVCRRKTLVLGIIVSALGAAIGAIKLITPVYTADVMVVLDSRKTQYINFDQLVSGLTADAQVVRTELNVIQSPAIARRVVDQLDLIHDTEFNPLDDSGTVAGPLLKVKRFFTLLTRSLGASKVAEATDAPGLVLERLLSRLSVDNDGRSYNIAISFTSLNPDKASTIANAFARQYLLYQIDVKKEVALQANDWLSSRLKEARSQVRSAEEAIQRFRGEHGVIGRGETSVELQQLTDLDTQLIAATSARVAAEAHLRSAEQQRGQPDGISEVLTSPYIQTLRQSEVSLEQRRAELSQHFGDKSSQMEGLVAQIKDLQQRIRAEVNKILVSIKIDVETAATRENLLRKTQAEIENRAGSADRAIGELRELEREAEASRTLFKTLAERYEQTQALVNAETADARIVAPARPPVIPSSPNAPRIIGIALLGSVVLGFGCVVLLERIDDGFRTSSDVETITGLPCVGMVPNLDPKRLVRRGGTRIGSMFAEAIRTVRTSIGMLNWDLPPKVLVVTSSVPEEGKSVFAVALARALGEAGRRTLLIDCDLRRPRIAELTSCPKGPELPDLLLGKVAGIQPQMVAGVGVIATINPVANAQDLLAGPLIGRFIVAARAEYDFVVLDTPPIMLVADAALVSSLADAVLYVVRWGSTPRETVLTGLKRLRSGSKIAGVVLSRVDMFLHNKFGFKDEGHYLAMYGKRYETVAQAEGRSGKLITWR
jgi:capsular exopolysaccharide synthesis family protein